MNDKNLTILHKSGIKTQTYKDASASMDEVRRMALDKISAFKKRHEEGTLNEMEKNSYLARAIERQSEEDSVITFDVMNDIFQLMLNASVDTTSTFMSWALVHLSVNPEAQERLYQEIKANVAEAGGTLTSEAMSKKKSPYLHAVLRESHRLTPVHPTTMSKSNSGGPIEIHGVEFPKDSVFMFDQFSLGMDPDVVENPEKFDPDRWSAEATEARKGTRMAMLDHQFYKDPFSQGARRCPGSRVAVNETLTFLAQFILDWKVEPVSDNIKSYKDIEYEQQTMLVPKLPKMNLTRRSS